LKQARTNGTRRHGCDSFDTACCYLAALIGALMLSVLLDGLATAAEPAAAGRLILVEKGVSLAPVIVFEDAPPLTRAAADELAQYIEKTSGAKPEVIEGESRPIPEHAIWVGYQPALKRLFPKIDFEFKHAEEILIAANGGHLVIAGRDRWNPDGLVGKGRRNTVNGVQQEYGTCNAVYTFIQDFLDVRWLWPGDLGEDVIERETISFAPFEYRYHPPLRSRAGLFGFSVLLRHSAYGHSGQWTRFQRLQLDSLYVHPGHAFKTWWDRFHKTNPEFFALQPDGTRGNGETPYPSATTVKMCESNPGVWRQWLADVAELIEENPSLTCFNASPNDGYGLGNCVCERCRAWDHPDADTRPFIWRGLAQRYLALSDRDVTFANQCARLLKERYPDKDYRVSMNAYGNSRPAPLKAVPAGNVVISNVANMFWSLDTLDKDTIDGKTYAREYANWGNVTKNQVWRPNTGNPAGWQNALPDVPIERVMKSFRYAIDNHCIGIVVDMIWEHWATQGPLYYALTHMTWDPSKDWRAVMDDYYHRGFGPAWAEIKAYWEFLEASRNRKVDDYPGEANGYDEVYDQAFFDRAYGLLDRAASRAAGAPEKFRRRIAFVRVGLDHTRLVSELRALSRTMLLKGFDDDGAADPVRAKWDEVQKNAERIPYAIHWPTIRPGQRMARGGLFHPDKTKGVKSRQIALWKRKAAPEKQNNGKAAELRKAEEAGWELVFADDFERDELGKNWKAVTGTWTVEKGSLQGGGALISTRPFPEDGAPAYLRMEYEAVPDMKVLDLGGGGMKGARISDMSAFLHARDASDESGALSSGYFFQFGGRWNTVNRIDKAGETIAVDGRPRVKIKSNRPQRIVVENDHGRLSLFVDGRHVLTARAKQSVIGEGHNRVGFYFYTAARVLNLKVYVKRLSSGLDVE